MPENSDDLLDLLQSRQEEVQSDVSRLSRSADWKDRQQRWLGFLTIAVSAVLGGSLGSTLVTDVGWLSEPLWRLIGATLGVVSAIAAGIQTRGNLAEQAQTQRLLSTKYDWLKREVERYRALYSRGSQDIDPPETFLHWLDNTIRGLREEEAGGTEHAQGAWGT